jgi:hypothetical protein
MMCPRLSQKLESMSMKVRGPCFCFCSSHFLHIYFFLEFWILHTDAWHVFKDLFCVYWNYNECINILNEWMNYRDITLALIYSCVYWSPERKWPWFKILYRHFLLQMTKYIFKIAVHELHQNMPIFLSDNIQVISQFLLEN